MIVTIPTPVVAALFVISGPASLWLVNKFETEPDVRKIAEFSAASVLFPPIGWLALGIASVGKMVDTFEHFYRRK
jgi:hypothetical protein